MASFSMGATKTWKTTLVAVEYLISGILFLVCGLCLGWLATFKGPFSQQGIATVYQKIHWQQVAIVFAVSFFFQKFSLRLMALAIPPLNTHPIAADWTANGMVILLGALIIPYARHVMETFGQFWSSLKWGLFTFIIVLPWVLLSSLLTHYLVLEIFNYPPLVQDPYKGLEIYSLDMPIFYGSALTAILVSPFIEEIIFRGFFQNLMRKIFRNPTSIIITSLFFSLAHYQSGQGFANLTFLIPSFVFSFFLSYLYHKTGSLYACTILHASFNALAILSLIIEKS